MRLLRASQGFDFDLAVVGGGSAAFAAAIRAAELGAGVAVIESGVIGGTCVNRGCVPTKNLLRAAERYWVYRSNGFPGVPGGSETADFQTIWDQKDDLVRTMRKAKYEDVLAAHPSITYISGRAAFRSPHEIAIGDRVLTTDKVILATGASPAVPPIEGLATSGYLTYQESLELDRLPESLVVIGAGAIGLELGQIFARLGSRVAILEALPRIAPGEEPAVSEALSRYLSAEGIGLHPGAKIREVRKGSCCVAVEAEIDGERQEFRGERLVLAAGLRPATSGIGLAEAGVEIDARETIRVDATLRTTARNIWAAGDVIGGPMLVTTAAVQGQIAAENALAQAGRRFEPEGVPHAIFTDPEVASVGLTEEQARRRGREVRVGSVSFDLVPKAAAIRDTRGLLRLVVDGKNYRILGAHLVAPGAADLIHIGVLAVTQGMTVGDLLRTTFVYPTLAEAFKIAALSLHKDVTKMSCCAQ